MIAADRALGIALRYAAMRWPVFPCGLDKKPLTEHGFKDASCDEDEIRRVFGRHPGAMVGIATGAARLVVVDVDVKHGVDGYESLHNLEQEIGVDLSDTMLVDTPSGGQHAYFRANEYRIGSDNSGKLIGPGVDVKAEGGYVIAPGSGNGQGDYIVVDGHGPDRLADLPPQLGQRLAFVKKTTKKAATPGGGRIPEGSRHGELVRIAGAMRNDGASETEILTRLRVMAVERCDPPYTDTSDIENIARDAVTKFDRNEPAAAALVYEAAHAEVLKSAWRGLYRWAAHEKTWRRWNGHVWDADDESVVVAAAQKTLRRHYAERLQELQNAGEDKRLRDLHKLTCRYTSVIGGLAFLRGEEGFFTAPEQWDADPYILNCADGLLDLRTRQMRPHDPEAMCTRITRWPLGGEDDATSGAWQQHLEKCLPDADVRRQVQRDLGRSLVDAVLEHSLSIWYGVGRNGKSTTADALLVGLAGYGTQAAKDLLVTSRHEHHPTEIAELAGRRLVFVEETADGKSLDEAQVKRLTGGGNKRAHFMHRDNFDVPQTFSISLLVNHRPHVRSGDPGIWERLRLIPWGVRIPFSEQRPQDEVVAELVEDGAWMLRWVVAGFGDWQTDHHWVADAVTAATKDYRAEEDAVQGFIDRLCIEDPRATVAKSDLHEIWAADYLEQNPGATKAPSKIALGKLLRDRGIVGGTDGHAKVEIWCGLTLKVRPEPAQRTLE